MKQPRSIQAPAKPRTQETQRIKTLEDKLAAYQHSLSDAKERLESYHLFYGALTHKTFGRLQARRAEREAGLQIGWRY